MARAPFTYPFCYTPAPDIVAAAQRLIRFLDSLNLPNGNYSDCFDLQDGSRGLENRSHPWLRKWEGPADAVSGRDERVARSFPAPCYHPNDFGPHGSLQLRLLKEGKMLGVLKVADKKGEEGYLYAFSGTVGGRATLPGFVPPIFDLTDPDGYFRKREAEISAMAPGEARRAASAELQTWIFDQYRVSNARGETLSIREVFARRGLVPPGGTGDCAAPKLLQYAYSHGLTPLAMGEFWYGASPASEVREQGRFYPSCTGKCGPLLSYMLEGLDVAPNPLDREYTTDAEPRILHEDADILVVNKPAGMLAVPGRTRAVSLLDWLRARYGEVHSCHRLDMDTSGVMVFARNLPAKVELERQFAGREVAKTYRARLVAGDKPFGHAPRGTIALPLALDYYDRPRQMVDREHGKLAITEYEVLTQLPDGEIDIRFTPKTGRTHQLRVHAAHADGLGRPIKGDRLYGSPDGGRLWLHAESLTIHHPASGAPMRFESVSE
jgi:tRNA pseudouridine32 synthase/23S rRNA pseudouridine746 synthase